MIIINTYIMITIMYNVSSIKYLKVMYVSRYDLAKSKVRGGVVSARKRRFLWVGIIDDRANRSDNFMHNIFIIQLLHYWSVQGLFGCLNLDC